MEHNRLVLVLGGSGLVGSALVQALLASSFNLTPIVFDRRKPPEFISGVEYVIGDHVNIFDSKFMLGLVEGYNPMAIIDAVNIASLASRSGDLLGMVTDYLLKVMRPVAQAGVIWLDIGTVATGGMGIEIPYTHNEACAGEIAPGLILKNAAASLHGGFLDLLGRTPGFRVGRVVPRGMIGFEPPIYGPMFVAHLGGVPRRFEGRFMLLNEFEDIVFEDLGEFCEVGDRCGENGFFGLEETAAITAIGQMETVSAEAVASGAMDVLGRLMGNSGTYIQHELQPDVTSFAASRRVLKAMADLGVEHRVPSVCFGNLGPFMTTHLWELWVLAQCEVTPNELAEEGFASDWPGTFDSEDRVFHELAGTLPGLGVPVLTDTEFLPCVRYERDNNGRVTDIIATLSADEVVTQYKDCLEGKMWFVDLRQARVAFWSEQARLIANCTLERSHLPLSGDSTIQPGGFWAAFNIARGHGRQAYSAGSRH